MRILRLVCLISCIFAVLGGECLKDSNTNQPSSAYNQRLWSYSPSHLGAVSSSSTLTFMTYNLQSSISANCVSNPQTQAGFMTTDFVGNQEVVQGVDTRCNCNMPQIIASGSGHNVRYVMTFPWRTGQYGIALGTAQTILETQYLLYTYAGAEQRALVAVKTKPPGLNGHALWFISTHVDYTVAAARHSEVTQLVAWVRSNIIAKDSTASVVVVGDFNSDQTDQAYTTMKGLFKNSWEVFHGSSGSGFTYPSPSPSIRFDHIWYYTGSGVTAQPTDVTIVSTTASDHRPLKASIKFTTSGSVSSSTPAPAATPAPTHSATSAPASPTHAATSAPTTAPSSGSGSCSVLVSYVSSANAISIKNTGSKAVKSLTLHFSPSVPANNWNLLATSTANAYSLPSWAYGSLGVGQTYSSSGFYTSGTKPTITATVSC